MHPSLRLPTPWWQGKRYHSFSSQKSCIQIKDPVQVFVIGGSNTNLFISRVWKEFLWRSCPLGPSFSGFSTSSSHDWGLPGGSDGKRIRLPCRRLGFGPRVRKMPWRRICNPLQYSCLENPLDRGDWQVTVHGVSKSWHTSQDFSLNFGFWGPWPSARARKQIS